ncbi:MAG: lamin tail domain-containing protein [Bacteroidales bacterium]|nr:lamin tail domain-containing protein [Bacteroidales bacterium]
MNQIFTLGLASLIAATAWGGNVTDVIDATTVVFPDSYVQQEATLSSGATYLITVKDEGSGPQFKAGGSSIVTSVSPGLVQSIAVTWGSKSNEDMVVYGSTEPYTASDCEVTGTELGTISFTASSTATLEIEGEWPYIALTSTAVKGKACQFTAIEITWTTDGATPEADPMEGLVINEVCGDDATTDGLEDWIEIVNSTDATLALEGLQVEKIDEDGESTILYTYPEGSEIAAGEYIVCSKGSEFSAGISNTKNVTIRLISADGTVLDTFSKANALTDNGNHYVGGSYSRIPDITGTWTSVANATRGEENDPTLPEAIPAVFKLVDDVNALEDGMEFILVNVANAYAMASSWGTTKDGGVYQLAEEIEIATDGTITVDTRKVAVCTLVGNDDGDATWAILFGETNNYLNDSRYLACEEFKCLDYKKSDSASKGTRASISFNEDGEVEISYGDEAGSLKFNLKDDGTSRFLNYDPTDKPEDHLAIHMYKAVDDSTAISTISIPTEEDTTPIYYNLQGVRVTTPTTGIYILRQGSKTTKVLIR